MGAGAAVVAPGWADDGAPLAAGAAVSATGAVVALGGTGVAVAAAPQATASSISLSGRECILALVRDITERRRSEQVLRDLAV